MKRPFGDMLLGVHRPRIHEPFSYGADTKGTPVRQNLVALTCSDPYLRSKLINSTGNT